MHSFLKQRLDGTIRLSRYREFLWFVAVTTLLGAGAAGGKFGIPLITALVANWLAVGYMFMINDVEDAHDDALTPHKAVRNPICAGALSRRSGWLASTIVALLAAFLFSLLGFFPALCGWLSLFLGFIYSWRGIRLKSLPVVDFLSHALMLAGLQFLVGFFAFRPGIEWWWYLPFGMVVSISLYGELFNELRDLPGDRQAGLRHTAVIFGHRVTQILMYIVLAVGIICGAITLLIIHMLPWWVFGLNAVLLAVFLIPVLLGIRRAQRNHIAIQEPLQKPFEMSFSLSLAAWFILPWLGERIGLALLH